MGSVVMSERLPNVVHVPIGTLAATTTLPGMYFRKKSRIKHVHLINQASLAADNTNYLQLSLQDVAGGNQEYAALDTRAAHEGALTAMTPKELTLTASLLTGGEVEVPAGTTLQLVATKNGTGVPTLAELQIEWYPL
jgi:hypothetical protein